MNENTHAASTAAIDTVDPGDTGAVTPHDEAIVEPSERDIEARWKVGEPDAEGYQMYAELSVGHEAGRGYYAMLHVACIQESDGPITRRKMMLGIRAVRIHVEAPQRFHAARFPKVYDAALAELRRRFDSRDVLVTAYFDPSSAIHSPA